MKTKWLVQTNLINQDQVFEVLNSLREVGIEYEEYNLIPFDDSPLIIKSEGNYIIPYGSTSFMKKCIPMDYSGFFYDLVNSKTSEWIKHRTDMLNQDAIVCSLVEAKKYMENNPYGCYFVKPDNDLKDFTGEVCDGKSFGRWVNDVSSNGYLFDDTINVVMSEPKYISWEARFFVVGRRVISGSYYKQGRYSHIEEIKDPSILAIAQEKANNWLPYECVTMDLAETNDGIKVVEFNNINSSGFYKCNIYEVIKSLTEYVGNKGITHE